MRLIAKARIQVTVEVEAGAWGGDCSIDQLYKQAAEEGVNKVRNALQAQGCKALVLANPKVLGVITEEK